MIDLSQLFIASFFIFGLNYILGSPIITPEGRLRVLPAIGCSITMFLFHSWKGNRDVFMPIFLCVVCMSSLWGSLIFFWFNPVVFTFDFLSSWIIFVITLAGLNRLLKSYL